MQRDQPGPRSSLNDSGGREERPWERGWCTLSSINAFDIASPYQHGVDDVTWDSSVQTSYLMLFLLKNSQKPYSYWRTVSVSSFLAFPRLKLYITPLVIGFLFPLISGNYPCPQSSSQRNPPPPPPKKSQNLHEWLGNVLYYFFRWNSKNFFLKGWLLGKVTDLVTKCS